MTDAGPGGANGGGNPALNTDDARAENEKRLVQARGRLRELGETGDPVLRAELQLQVAEALLNLGRAGEVWDTVRSAFDVFVTHEHWESAVATCDVLYQADQPGSLAALGNGIWLSVTYPVAPQLTVSMLHHVVDETPDQSDGAAVAAVAAHYIAEHRSADAGHDGLTFLTAQVIARVAKRHRGIEGEENIGIWIEVLQLNDVPELLDRLARILDAIVDGDWWMDRDALRDRLPAE